MVLFVDHLQRAVPPPPPSAVLCRSWGLILYRTWVPASALDQEAELDLGAPAHDYASVLVDGELAGRMNRSRPGTSRTKVHFGFICPLGSTRDTIAFTRKIQEP